MSEDEKVALKGTIDPRDYGVWGDGRHDDTVAWERVREAAAKFQYPIYLPAGFIVRYPALAAKENTIELNPDDPFDKVVINMVEMNRKKRLDYAADSDPFSNFRDTADDFGMAGFGPAESAQILLLTKVARLKSLRLNGRMDNPSNESVLDTYLDLAVYATILLALVKEEASTANTEARESKIKAWNKDRVDQAYTNLETVKEWRARNADSSATEETSRPGPEHVRPGRSVAFNQAEKERAVGDYLRTGLITETEYNEFLAYLRSGTANGAPAENNDDKDVQSMSSEFLD